MEEEKLTELIESKLDKGEFPIRIRHTTLLSLTGNYYLGHFVHPIKHILRRYNDVDVEYRVRDVTIEDIKMVEINVVPIKHRHATAMFAERTKESQTGFFSCFVRAFGAVALLIITIAACLYMGTEGFNPYLEWIYSYSLSTQQSCP